MMIDRLSEGVCSCQYSGECMIDEIDKGRRYGWRRGGKDIEANMEGESIIKE